MGNDFFDIYPFKRGQEGERERGEKIYDKENGKGNSN